MAERPSLRQILEPNAVPAPNCVPRLGDSANEFRMMLQAIVEPVLLALETDEHARRPAVAGDENFLGRGQAQESREIVFDLSQRHLAYRASRAPRANAPLRFS